jgi:hypothetical protein
MEAVELGYLHHAVRLWLMWMPLKFYVIQFSLPTEVFHMLSCLSSFSQHWRMCHLSQTAPESWDLQLRRSLPMAKT